LLYINAYSVGINDSDDTQSFIFFSNSRELMKAAYIIKTGPPETILYGDLPAPKPGPTKILQYGPTCLRALENADHQNAIVIVPPRSHSAILQDIST